MKTIGNKFELEVMRAIEAANGRSTERCLDPPYVAGRLADLIRSMRRRGFLPDQILVRHAEKVAKAYKWKAYSTQVLVTFAGDQHWNVTAMRTRTHAVSHGNYLDACEWTCTPYVPNELAEALTSLGFHCSPRDGWAML